MSNRQDSKRNRGQVSLNPLWIYALAGLIAFTVVWVIGNV